MASDPSVNLEGIPTRSAIAFAVSMALTGHAGQAQAQQDDGMEPAETQGIEEITVTARKQAESLQDIGASIQALSGDEIKRRGLVNMEDVIRFLPSVQHLGGTAGANKIIFRGVSDNPVAFIAASSAALYIDEQPLTQFSINPEPRMVDIERVESLAGPQGTLYGDSSQSGTLRIITNKPDPTAFSASVDAMFRTGSESAASNEVSGVLNLPLIENKFAIRLVGFTATDGGFIDNVLGTSPMKGTKDNADVVQDDINEVDHYGGRLSAKWFINDEWSATFSYINQTSKADGRNDYDPTVGDLETVKFFKDERDDKWWQTALTLEGQIGNVEITSITSYFDREIDYVFDRTVYSAYFNYNFCPLFATYCWAGQAGAEAHYYGYGPISVDPGNGLVYYSTAPNDQDVVGRNTLVQQNDRITQEIRLSQSGDNYRWILGAFYEEKSEDWVYRAQTPEFLTSLSYYYWTSFYEPSGVDPSWWLSADSTDWEQWAVFGNFNYDFNENWSAEIGLRYFDQTMDRLYYVDKPFVVAEGYPDATDPKGGNSDTVPKVSLTWNITDDHLVYALYSEGWRPGGQNRNRTPFTVFPQAYEPDLLKNFEVGTKTRWLDGRLQVNATAFFGNWENYQIEVIDPSFQPCEDGEIPDVDLCSQPFQVLVANVGDAEQQGLELEMRAAPTDRTDFGLNLTYVNAETSESFFVTSEVPKGQKLPNVPELKYNTWLQYNWPVSFVTAGEMYARVQYSWQDDSRNQLEDFEAPDPGERLVSGAATYIQPSYGIADLKLGLRTDKWTLEAFANNVSDERAVLFNNPYFFDSFWGKRRVNTNRPREYGVRFAYYWQ